jgi:glycosyltransferase involved in cell wall biosynthesis
MEEQRKYKIVYVTPALYMAGGVERVLTLKANYFAEQLGYDITIILTEGKDNPFFYPLSPKVKVINFDLNFEELWTCSFLKKVRVYLPKQRRFKKLLTAELMRIRPDITISLLRRDINFMNGIKDGSKKIGELHVNRANYRNFEADDTNLIKQLFAKFWMWSLVGHLKELDLFVVLTESERLAWPELSNVWVIPDPLSFQHKDCSSLTRKRVISIGRYAYQKGVDLLLQAWAKIEMDYPDWEMVYYGQGDREPFLRQAKELNLNLGRCHLNDKTTNVQQELLESSIFVLSSRFEGFGMVIIEAMACGLPVVSFDCKSGPSEIISEGEDGFLVPVGDVDALAEKLSILMSHQEMREQLGKKAYKHSFKYDIDDIAKQWVQLFDKLMGK